MGLPILLVFSHFYLHERLARHEWAAIGMTGAGILLLGLGSDTSGVPQEPAAPGRTLATFGAMQAALAAEIWWRHGGGAGQAAAAGKHAPPQAVAAAHREALLCGLECGVFFGFSGASFRCARVCAVNCN